MFSLKNKLDPYLKSSIDQNQYKTYRVLVHCKNLFENVEKKIQSYKGSYIRSLPSINCIAATLTPKVIGHLLEYPHIDHIHFDSYAFLCGSSVLAANGIFFQEKYKLTGKGIGIGIVDSGVYPHPDLLNPYNKVKKFVDLINNFKYPYDDHGHGTSVSGLLCSSGYSSKGMYRGIAEGSHIYAVKAFNKIGKGFISDILSGVETLLEESEAYNIRVLCLPFETVDYDPFILSLFDRLFDSAVQKGMVIVVPSGHNQNVEGSIRGIATLSTCITVGGIDTKSSIKPYEFSSWGPFNKLEKPDLAAACVDIISLNTNTEYISERNGMKIYAHLLEKNYTTFTGTSYAAAYISGLCAMLFENNPKLTYKDVISLLKVSCKPLPIEKWAQGAGIVEVDKLLP